MASGVETGTQLVLARIVLNRSVAGLPLFRKEADFEAFERIMILPAGKGYCAPRRRKTLGLSRSHGTLVLSGRKDLLEIRAGG